MDLNRKRLVNAIIGPTFHRTKNAVALDSKSAYTCQRLQEPYNDSLRTCISESTWEWATCFSVRRR